MNIKQRITSKTPSFWKKVQKLGIIAGTVGGAILASPVTLPAALISIAGYLVTAGTVTAALSQLTIEDKNETDS